MFTSVILEKNCETLKSETIRCLNSIKNESQRMRNILNDLLVFSEFKKSSQEFVPVDLNVIVVYILKFNFKNLKHMNI